jgi:Spy/CpxP family protein refolding chaperone
MKKNWLVYLVIFSLALNVGILGALVYFRLQPPPDPLLHEGRLPGGLKELLHSLNLDQEQQQLLKQKFPAHRQQIKELRQQLHQQRQKLYELIDQAQPSESEIAAQITVINNLQNALEQEMVRFLLQIKQNLRPEQQEMLLQRVGQRLCGSGFCGPRKTGGRPGRVMDRCRDNLAPPPPPAR